MANINFVLSIIFISYFLSIFNSYFWGNLILITIFACIIRYFIFPYIEKYNKNYAIREHRELALEAAKIYLAPYQDIWSDLKLSNKKFEIHLTRNRIIKCKQKLKDNSKTGGACYLVIDGKENIDETWDFICFSINHIKTYKELLLFFERNNIKYKTTSEPYDEDLTNFSNNTEKKIKKYSTNKHKIDINNASEVEITSLPGINIVISKKIIKRREEINGFKNKESLFEYIKVKEHIKKQLENIIEIKPMKGSVFIKKHKERKVDL